jgi:hypothetical protein
LCQQSQQFCTLHAFTGGNISSFHVLDLKMRNKRSEVTVKWSIKHFPSTTHWCTVCLACSLKANAMPEYGKILSNACMIPQNNPPTW